MAGLGWAGARVRVGPRSQPYQMREHPQSQGMPVVFPISTFVSCTLTLIIYRPPLGGNRPSLACPSSHAGATAARTQHLIESFPERRARQTAGVISQLGEVDNATPSRSRSQADSPLAPERECVTKQTGSLRGIDHLTFGLWGASAHTIGSTSWRGEGATYSCRY
ncbi:hypothetical protein GGR56DRAFT_407993 [Xylariaceae sp. FL0804]|nr:hypothetical protein GGR56DRAFT_407993 [Xylariaceae sp. FL0804]